MSEPDLSQFLPPRQRFYARSRRRAIRVRTFLGRRQVQITVILLLYVLVALTGIVIGQGLLTVLALLPIMLMPPLAWAIYQLIWHEYHR